MSQPYAEQRKVNATYNMYVRAYLKIATGHALDDADFTDPTDLLAREVVTVLVGLAFDHVTATPRMPRLGAKEFAETWASMKAVVASAP